MKTLEPLNKDPPMTGTPKYDRIDGDSYFTPAWCTEALLKSFVPKKTVWEPAAGRGDIVAVLEKKFDVIASDITLHPNKKCFTTIVERDFFATNNYHPKAPFSIITNPPYNRAEEFVRRSLDLMTACGGTVAMLLRNEWDCASSRSDLFTRESFSMKIVLTKRPRWIEGTKISPRHNYAWFVWDFYSERQPIITWDQ